VAAGLAALPVCGFGQSGPGQTYPVKPIRIIVPLAPGGNVDIVARSLAQQLTENLRQQVIVENRPGASSLVGTQLAARSPPDGYTLLAMANTFAMVPSIVANPGYDPLKDFSGVTLTCLVPQVLVVNPALPVRSVKQLIALARARPGELSYATASWNGASSSKQAPRRRNSPRTSRRNSKRRASSRARPGSSSSDEAGSDNPTVC